MVLELTAAEDELITSRVAQFLRTSDFLISTVSRVPLTGPFQELNKVTYVVPSP